MKTAIIATALALAGSAFAAPAPHTKIQGQIQTLEVQILNVINDIVQSSPNLVADYNTGATQYGVLSNILDGPQPCSPFVPGRPTTKKQAIKALQTSQEGLMQLSLDLQNPALNIKAGDFHADICNALGYYSAVSQFVGV
jgi:hypothetical protein